MCKPRKKILVRAEEEDLHVNQQLQFSHKRKSKQFDIYSFKLSNRIYHENLFSSPVIYKQAN